MYKSTGFISFVLRRFTGLVLVGYLFVHIWVIGSATQGAEAFNARMEALETPVTLILWMEDKVDALDEEHVVRVRVPARGG